MKPLYAILSTFLTSLCLSVSATDSSFVDIRFAPPLSPDKFAATIHDGINEHRLQLPGQLSWNGILLSPYGYIDIYYRNSDSTYISRQLFFRKGKSTVVLQSESDPADYFSVDEKKSNNIVMYDALGGAEMKAYVKSANDAAMAHYHQHKHHFNEALLARQFALGDSVVARNIEYIRQHPRQYVSFWTFLTNIIKTNLLKPDQLLDLYNTSVPEAYKKSKSGIYLANLIHTKIAISSQQAFPDFNTKDIEGKTVSSAALRGNLVLIQFWASWCKPCIHEIPALKAIREKYSGSPFQLISFSIDKDAEKFRKAIEEHGMNWTQVHGDLNLYHAMSYTPIPQLYLVDKAGKTIYNSTIVHDNDLTLLKKILSEQLGKRQ